MRACWFVTVVSIAALAACRGESGRSESLIENGRYLVDHVYICGDCHTPALPGGRRDKTRYLSGVECLFDVDPASGKGCIHSRNLTSHPTGLGNVADDRAIKEMILEGRRPDGKLLHSAMPSYLFHNMPPEHVDAIVAFLRKVPGVDHRVPRGEPPFDQPPAIPTPPLPLASLPPVPRDSPDPTSAERGRKLAAAAACVICHSPPAPEREPGKLPLDTERLFAGGRAFPAAPLGVEALVGVETIYSQNLTRHPTGLSGWSAGDVVRALKEGKDREGKGICPPMPSGPSGSYHGLRDGDARDIANYIVMLPGIDNPLPNQCALEPTARLDEAP